MAKAKSEPTFIVRLTGPDLAPDRVPFRAVSAALSAVQDLASGRDPLETRQVPEDQLIGLVTVRRGSAIYSCVSRAPDEARRNLRLVGQLLSGQATNSSLEEGLARALKPIEKLSEVAKSIDCRVEVSLASRPRDALFSVNEDDFAKLSTRLFLTGETTVIGTVKRVGGQTGMKCALSVPGRRHLLYCDVKTRVIVRRLGQHLYEEIAARGDVVWIHSSWHIYKFTIRDFTQPKLDVNVTQTIEQLRDAGLDAWDRVADPGKLLRELRT